jgi:hypothetical protein
MGQLWKRASSVILFLNTNFDQLKKQVLLYSLKLAALFETGGSLMCVLVWWQIEGYGDNTAVR